MGVRMPELRRRLHISTPLSTGSRKSLTFCLAARRAGDAIRAGSEGRAGEISSIASVAVLQRFRGDIRRRRFRVVSWESDITNWPSISSAFTASQTACALWTPFISRLRSICERRDLSIQ